MAGALLAWSVAIVFWTTSSYKARQEVIISRLEHAAELDLLHARINQIAKRLNAPTVNLTEDLHSILMARQQRIAHLYGLEEFGPMGDYSYRGYPFWTQDAYGVDDDLEIPEDPSA